MTFRGPDPGFAGAEALAECIAASFPLSPVPEWSASLGYGPAQEWTLDLACHYERGGSEDWLAFAYRGHTEGVLWCLTPEGVAYHLPAYLLVCTDPHTDGVHTEVLGQVLDPDTVTAAGDFATRLQMVLCQADQVRVVADVLQHLVRWNAALPFERADALWFWMGLADQVDGLGGLPASLGPGRCRPSGGPTGAGDGDDLVPTIRGAFPTEPVPADPILAEPATGHWGLACRRWPDVDTGEAAGAPWLLALLTPAAFAYYLAAHLLPAVSSEPTIADAVVELLDPGDTAFGESFGERTSHLRASREQSEAIAAVLRRCDRHELLPAERATRLVAFWRGVAWRHRLVTGPAPTRDASRG